MKKQTILLAMLAVVLAFGLAFAGCETGTDSIIDGDIITGHTILSQNVTNPDVGTTLNVMQTKYINTNNQLLIGCEVLGCTSDYFFVKSTFNGLIDPNNNTVSELEMYNEAFFVENNLVLIVLKNSNNNSGDIVELRTISVKDNELSVIVDKYSGDAADAVYGLFFIPIKKGDFDGDTVNVKVVLQ